MKVYSSGVISQLPAVGSAFCGLWSPTRRTRILEVQVVAAGGGQDTLALFRTTARGTASTTISGESEDGSNESPTAVIDRAYSADPTFSGGSMAEVVQPSAVGNRMLTWEFWDSLLWVPSGEGLALKNIGAASGQGHETYWVWEE